MTAENVSVSGAALLQSVLQRACDVLLSDDLGKFLRTVFARQDGVAHGWKKRLYVIARSSKFAKSGRKR
jgi:hypothetical protein